MIVEHSAVNLTEAKVDSKWSKLPGDSVVEGTVSALGARGFNVVVAKDAAEALAAVRKIIPKDAEVMNGSSTTLNEIGFGELLKSGGHGWRNLHEGILAEKDAGKQAELRRKAVTADYFVSGVNALTQDGEMVAADASGSRVGAFLFAANHLVLVAGTNKIVPSLDDAFARLREYVFPLEDARAKRVYGMGSSISKIVVLAAEPYNKGRVTVVLVREKLGY